MADRYYANGLPLDLVFIEATDQQPADTNNPSGFKVEVPVDTNDINDTNTVIKDLSDIFAALKPNDVPGPQIQLFSESANDSNIIISLSNFYKTDSNFLGLRYNPFSACKDISTDYIYFIINDDWQYIPRQNYEGVTLILIGAGGGGGSGLGYTGGGAGGNYLKKVITLTAGYKYIVTIGKGGAGGAYTYGNFYGNSGKPGGSTSFVEFNGVEPGDIFEFAAGGGGGGGSKRGTIGQGGTNNNPNNYGYGGTYSKTITNTSGTGKGYGYDGVSVTFPTEGIYSNGTTNTQTVTFTFAPGGGAGGRDSSGTRKPMMPGGGGVGIYQQQTQYGCDTNTTFGYDTGGNGGLGSMGISTFNGNFYNFDGNNYNVGSGGGGGGNNSARNYSRGGAGGDGLAILVVPKYNGTGTGTIDCDPQGNDCTAQNCSPDCVCAD